MSFNTSFEVFDKSLEDMDQEFVHMYDTIPIKIIVSFAYIFILFFGSVLWFSIIHFEIFGEDSQKRSITNKLWSCVAFLSLLIIWINQNIYFMREVLNLCQENMLFISDPRSGLCTTYDCNAFYVWYDDFSIAMEKSKYP